MPSKTESTPPPGVAAFAALVRRFAKDPRVTPPTEGRGKFGDNGLRVDGRIFAMCVRGRLVLKLPRERVDRAVAEQRGERLSMGAGRVMKEWLVVSTEGRGWAKLAEEARAFAAASDGQTAPAPAKRRVRPRSAAKTARTARG